MADAQHKAAPLGHRHPTHDFAVANAAARNALPVTPLDVGCDCIQTDTNPPTFWRLARVTGGVVWVQLGAGGMTTEQSDQLVAGLAAIATLRTLTFLVESTTGELSSERALEGAGPVSVSYATASKAIITIATALGGGTPAAGLMSGADKVALDAAVTKLASIANGATVGPADPTVVPLALADTTGSIGATGKYAAEQHVHPHGARAGGTLHATALGGGSPAAGFMSGADKVAHDANVAKLALLPAAATIDTTTVPNANTDAGAAGSGTALAPINHRHPHGTGIAGATTHATAVGGGTPVAGFMSGADKVAHDANTTAVAGLAAQFAAKASLDFDYVVVSTGTYTITRADAGRMLWVTVACVITAPISDAAIPHGASGGKAQVTTIVQAGSGAVSVAPGVGGNVRNRLNSLTTDGQYSSVTLSRVSATDWHLSGEVVVP